jgi:ABC-type lipoprotein release transport system permease subunit
VTGATGSLLLARMLRGFLAAEVSPLDPLAFGAMVATLLITSGAAVYLPARSSTRVDPLTTLRHE